MVTIISKVSHNLAQCNDELLSSGDATSTSNDAIPTYVLIVVQIL